MKGGRKRLIGWGVTLLAGLLGALFVEIIKYKSGRPSWMLDPMLASATTNTKAKAYLWGNSIGIRPNGESNIFTEWWSGAVVTIYCGRDAWTYRCDTIERLRRISLRDFTDSRGNRFNPDQRVPQRVRVTGKVHNGLDQRKATFESDLIATAYVHIYSPEEIKGAEDAQRRLDAMRREWEKPKR